MPKRPIKIKRCWEWKPSASGQIKVNLDDFFFGLKGREGNVGVFKDFEEDVLL